MSLSVTMAIGSHRLSQQVCESTSTLYTTLYIDILEFYNNHKVHNPDGEYERVKWIEILNIIEQWASMSCTGSHNKESDHY